jgi:hypothetical protein
MSVPGSSRRPDQTEGEVSGNREPATAPVEVTVLVDDAHLEAIDDVAAALARAGLRDGHTLEVTGVISGSLNDPRLVDALEQVEGVASVEVARRFQLPPPDEPVQ